MHLWLPCEVVTWGNWGQMRTCKLEWSRSCIRPRVPGDDPTATKNRIRARCHDKQCQTNGHTCWTLQPGNWNLKSCGNCKWKHVLFILNVSEAKVLNYYMLLHVIVFIYVFILWFYFIHIFIIIDKCYNIINCHLDLISYDGIY